MSGIDPVDPVGIPVFTGDLALLDTKVTALSAGGATIATAASDVHSSFGGLHAFYKAPEAEQLFATTKPVSDTGLSMSSDLCVISGALGTYSDDAYPLVEKLKELKREAVAFRVKVDGDDKWREDGDLVEENNHRRNEIAEVWTAFQEVERACHAKIVALVGGKTLKTNDGSGKEGMYGYDAEALKQTESLPWGDAVKESTPWWQVWEHGYDFGKGFIVDGVWGTIKGLGTLTGFDGWDAAKQAWTGLGKLTTGLVLTVAVGPAFWELSDDELPTWVRDSRTAMKETGKALVAWDQWGDNPSRAAGAVTFNVLTTVFTGGAVAGAGKAGLAAKALSFAGKAGRIVDPTTYVFKGAGAGVSKIGNVMAGLKGMGKIELPPLPDGTITLPEGALRLPDGTVDLPDGAIVPDGAVQLPNGTVKLPEGVLALPEGTVRSPFEDGPPFLDREGNLYEADGSLAQHAGQARPEQPATRAENPRVETSADKPVPVGAGIRGADDAGHAIHSGDSLDSNLGDIGRTSDAPSGGRAGDHAPGGTADNTIHNSHTPGGTDAPHTSGASTADNATAGGGHGDIAPGDRGRTEVTSNGNSHGSAENPAVPHQGGHGSPHPDATGGHADHNTPGSASTPAEAISPETSLRQSDGSLPVGPEQKLLELVDATNPRVTTSDGIITHIDGQPVQHYVDNIAQERAALYRDAKDARTFSKGQTGACVGAVMDRRTGIVIEGINGRADDIIPADKLHPTLRERREILGADKPHPDDPLGHAEVKATNELLWARTRLGLPDGVAALKEIHASVEFPFMKHPETRLPGRGAPFCANCYHMLPDMPTTNGKFTGYPPDKELNWIP
ncbi:hypothetical protein [Streptomyces sp. NPDC005262]|uniref:hypothetical protein n=1 Tax=Streptomyces sp. NPDC005262 TaxID=3364710 RepID=UPI0036AAB492